MSLTGGTVLSATRGTRIEAIMERHNGVAPRPGLGEDQCALSPGVPSTGRRGTTLEITREPTDRGRRRHQRRTPPHSTTAAPPRAAGRAYSRCRHRGVPRGSRSLATVIRAVTERVTRRDARTRAGISRKSRGGKRRERGCGSGDAEDESPMSPGTQVEAQAPGTPGWTPGDKSIDALEWSRLHSPRAPASTSLIKPRRSPRRAAPRFCLRK